MRDEQLEIQKRHTLNWLIQGASQHAGMTFHHLVREELSALDPKLPRYYDQFALIGALQFWRAQSTMLLGWPPKFWRRAASRQSHPFHVHPLLARYGGMLAQAGRQRALDRCKEKGVNCLPFAFSFQTAFLVLRLHALELPHRPRLIQLAKEVAATVWGIPRERLNGALVDRIALRAGMFPTQDTRGAVLRACIVGYSSVVRQNEKLTVVAKATNWQVLTKELVKGTAELICLHGLNQLDEETYQRVLSVTDRVEVEPWMLQTGGELWRRLLESLPDNCPVAHVLMRLACLPASTLESVVAAVIEQSAEASGLLTDLAC